MGTGIVAFANFWKFYFIRTGFTLGEPVSLVKVFRLFKLEQMFFGVESVDTVGRCTTSYLSTGPAWLWRFVLFCSCEIHHTGCLDCVLGVFGKLLIKRGAWAWFHDVWTCGAKVLGY